MSTQHLNVKARKQFKAKIYILQIKLFSLSTEK